MHDAGGSTAPLRPFAWKPVAGVAAAITILLLATSTGYGYHRDELYFRVLGHHLAWGYIDQPPLTPLLGRISTSIFGDEIWALRLPAVLCVAATAVLLALIARELDGAATAQTLAALGGAAAFTLIGGHLLLTATFDLVVWAAVILFMLKALVRDRPQWWLAAGAATGIGLYNRHLVVLLLLSVGLGALLLGPRRLFATRWLWLSVAVALLVGAPNLVYQATHGWPQFAMAHALAVHKGHDARTQLAPIQLILLGPPLVPIWIAGLVSLWRRESTRPIAVAYPVMCVLLLALAGQPYYTAGLLLALYSAGAVATVRWLAGRRLRQVAVGVGVGLNIVVSALIALPLVPVASLGNTPIPGVNQAARDQIGWPTYVRQVAAVYAGLSPNDRARTVVIAGNYGEAGAIARYGTATGLPAAYSGQNALWYLARPPAASSVAVLVGIDDQFAIAEFSSCTTEARLDNGVGVDNEEQGRSVQVCRGPRASWQVLWPRFRHLD